MDYRTAGVDVEAGHAFVERIRASVETTRRPEVIGGLGGFGGFFRLPSGFQRPVLVSGADGVGTKLELAQKHGKHFGVGIDLVAMCVNDVVTSGAMPLFFLDYVATGRLSPERLAEVVEGVAEGCRRCGCTLLGGETAEMPGFYAPGTYDLAGFCVGVVEEDHLVDGRHVKEGDAIVGIASSGVHSNGFSLVRRILETVHGDAAAGPWGTRGSLVEALLTPTVLYAPLVKGLIEEGLLVHGMAHITGGGLPENLPRSLPEGCHAVIDPTSWRRPALFSWLQEKGQIPEQDLWNTFNLGVGFTLVIPPQQLQAVLSLCGSLGYNAWEMGRIAGGSAEDGRPLAGLPY